MYTTINDVYELLEVIGRPPWLADLVVERLDLDVLFEKAYALGVEHGRAQMKDEHVHASELSEGPPSDASTTTGMRDHD